jgi:hypothetical protein
MRKNSITFLKLKTRNENCFGLIISVSLIYFFYEVQETREEIKKGLKESVIASGDSFDKFNKKISGEISEKKMAKEELVHLPENSEGLVLKLESSSSIGMGEDERLIELLENEPEKTLKTMAQILSRNPHSLVWSNSLNLLKNAKIDPDQKIEFLKEQLKSSGGLSDDEDQNIRVVNQYRRILGAMKEIYKTESRNLEELAEELGSITAQEGLKAEVKSILYSNNEKPLNQ